ncbi:MAG: hypothetical protein RSN88_06655 [Gordonibacter sp.]|uniref:hypothetical protein n=1 Tax=Gordonibacter sp. TaxID=1968902 RepID=UPI002FCAD33D
MSPPDAVVFSSGEHFYASEKGKVTFHVPRDITLNDLVPMLSAILGKGVKDAHTKEKRPMLAGGEAQSELMARRLF